MKKSYKKTCGRYQNLSKEEKQEKQQNGCELYKNLLEDKKMNWLSIEKKYKMRKKCFVVVIRKYFNLEKCTSL